MIRIFQYECKRLLWNKFFFGILLILLFYGWQVLNGVTILGVSHTAPFSPWSFGDYLSRMIPLLWIGALFFLTFFTSQKAQRVTILTNATPVPIKQYTFARCAAAFAGTGLLCLACLIEAAVFYGQYFGWYRWGQLLFPALITFIPPLIFALGSGWLLGKYKSWLIYLWMLIPFLCMTLPLPNAFGIWNGSFFKEYPLSIETMDPSFTLPITVIIVQCILMILGIVLLVLDPRFLKKMAVK